MKGLFSLRQRRLEASQPHMREANLCAPVFHLRTRSSLTQTNKGKEKKRKTGEKVFPRFSSSSWCDLLITEPCTGRPRPLERSIWQAAAETRVCGGRRARVARPGIWVQSSLPLFAPASPHSGKAALHQALSPRFPVHWWRMWSFKEDKSAKHRCKM